MFLLAMLEVQGIHGSDAETCLDALIQHVFQTPDQEPGVEARRAAAALAPGGKLLS